MEFDQDLIDLDHNPIEEFGHAVSMQALKVGRLCLYTQCGCRCCHWRHERPRRQRREPQRLRMSLRYSVCLRWREGVLTELGVHGRPSQYVPSLIGTVPSDSLVWFASPSWSDWFIRDMRTFHAYLPRLDKNSMWLDPWTNLNTAIFRDLALYCASSHCWDLRSVPLSTLEGWSTPSETFWWVKFITILSTLTHVARLSTFCRFESFGHKVWSLCTMISTYSR